MNIAFLIRYQERNEKSVNLTGNYRELYIDRQKHYEVEIVYRRTVVNTTFHSRFILPDKKVESVYCDEIKEFIDTELLTMIEYD